MAENFDNKAQKPSHKKQSELVKLFEGFDYEVYWDAWEKEHPGESKELDWGGPVGKEEFQVVENQKREIATISKIAISLFHL